MYRVRYDQNGDECRGTVRDEQTGEILFETGVVPTLQAAQDLCDAFIKSRG